MTRTTAALILLCLVCAIANVLIPFPQDIQNIFDTESVTGGIIWKIRFPRTCLALVVGAGLSLSGLTFQALFRNALATPFTLGVSSGASFGAAMAVMAGLTAPIMGIFSPIALAAFAGALGATMLVYFLATRMQHFDSHTLLLAGVATSFSLASLIMLVQHFSGVHQSYEILYWLMGGLETIGFSDTLRTLPWFVVGGAYVVMRPDELNLLSLGDSFARGRGLDVARERKRLFLCVSMMVGGIIATTGPIGFIGLVAPHICRLITGPNHRTLMITTILFGGAFLTICDLISRNIAETPIPVGVVTSLFGGPFFLWLLLRKKTI